MLKLLVGLTLVSGAAWSISYKQMIKKCPNLDINWATKEWKNQYEYVVDSKCDLEQVNYTEKTPKGGVISRWTVYDKTLCDEIEKYKKTHYGEKGSL